MIISTNRTTRIKITPDIDYSVTVASLPGGGQLVFAQGTTLLTVTADGTYTFTSDDSTKTLRITSTNIAVSVDVTISALDNASAGGSVSVVSSVLPSGAATSGNQTTANTKLDTIATNTAVQLGGGAVTGTTKRVTLATDSPGVSALTSIDAKTPVLVGNNADGEAAVSGGLQPVKNYPTLFNGSTWDRARKGLQSTADGASVTLPNDLNQTGIAAATTGTNVLAADGATAISATGYHSGSTQVIGSAGIGAGAVTFEQSNDGTNFTLMPVREDTATAQTLQTGAITIASSTARLFSYAVNSNFIRCRISTTVTGGTIQAFSCFSQLPYSAPVIAVQNVTAANFNTNVSGTVTIGTAVTPGTAAANLGKAEDAVAASGDTGVFVLGVRRDVAVSSASAAGDYNELSVGQYGDQYISKLGTRKRSYSSAFSIVPAASATDVVEIIGSATTTVEITRVTIGGVQTTAGQVLVNLLRRSTADTVGTQTAQTIVPHQATDAAAIAVIKAYTANPTTGTLVGNVRSRRLPIGSATSLIPATVYEFGENTKPLFLAGVAQTLCINLAGATVTGGTLDVEIEFTEV